MSGSVAEERIRAKAESWLRDICPEGRIIHELVMEQWGSRIDLAAVAPNRIIAVEIKSERDVLTRLAHQIEAAAKVVDHLFVAASACKVEKLARLYRPHLAGMVEAPSPHPGSRRWQYAPNPDYIGMEWPRRAMMMRETEGGLSAATDGVFPFHEHTMMPRLDLSPHHRLQMLWASELAQIAERKGTRANLAGLCADTMTGGDLRRAVCVALRRRPFPRADAPIYDIAVKAAA